MELLNSTEKGRKVIYAVCINADSPYILDRVRLVHRLGGNAVHINFWAGLGVYKAVRALDLPIFLFFQKSGSTILTDPQHRYHISWPVMCELAGMMGVDFIHAGMWGGYSNDNVASLTEVASLLPLCTAHRNRPPHGMCHPSTRACVRAYARAQHCQHTTTHTRNGPWQVLEILREHRVMPSLSCGMHPGLVKAISKRFGHEWMANTGGAIHGHPSGTLSGARAMRQAIDGEHGSEYSAAIQKWGLTM